MDSKKLEILMTAVNLGSFSKASEVVGYTQSGLTHLINGLEREIGMALIRRDHSGISLTENGEALLPAIRDYLSATAKLENQIAAITQKKAETIRVAAYASLAMHWMPEILYRFRRVCPDTDVDLRMVDHELEPFELLEEGRTDVIFAARQSHVNCDWTPLYNDIMSAILPEDYPTGGRDSFPIEEFDGKEFLMPYGRFDIDVNAALSPKGVRPQIRPCHVDDETVIRMVSKGLGVSMMPKLNGYDLARQVRAERCATPILMLTAKGELEDRIEGLNAGADYYLTKPFDTRELLACINALLRRQGDQVDELRFGNTALDLASGMLVCGAERVRLSAKEFDIMRFLLQSKGNNLSKEVLLARVWGFDSNAVENHVEVYVGFLRKKLASIGSNVRIEAVRRLGYHLEVADVC